MEPESPQARRKQIIIYVVVVVFCVLLLVADNVLCYVLLQYYGIERRSPTSLQIHNFCREKRFERRDTREECRSKIEISEKQCQVDNLLLSIN